MSKKAALHNLGCKVNAYETEAMQEMLEKAGYEFLSADIDMVPQNMVEVNAEQADSIYKLLDLLEDNDDVQNVYHNANLPEEEE